jgi:hypothetical protein
MSEARALLDGVCIEPRPEGGLCGHDERWMGHDIGGFHAIRRADRPEARVAVEVCSWVLFDGDPCYQTLEHSFHDMTRSGEWQHPFSPRPPEPESRIDTVRRMQREGGGPVTAVMVSRADEVPRPPEPDRTAALVTVGDVLEFLAPWLDGKMLSKDSRVLCEMLFAPTPDEAP